MRLHATHAKALLFSGLLLLLLAPAAQAGKVPGFGVLGTGATGAGAGQLGQSPLGVAVNVTGAGGVTAGDVYVSDSTNNRISQYAGSGAFIRAFGVDVVTAGSPNNASEVQRVTVKATAGEFKLIFGAGGVGVAETANLPYNATSGEVQAALNALTNISGGGGSVTVGGGPGDEIGSNPYVVTFDGAPLKGTDVAQITATNVSLAAGSPSSSVTVTTSKPGNTGFEICQAGVDTCKAGVSSALAGGINAGQGLAVDPATGNVFLLNNGTKRVNVYSATGQFQAAFGWNVNAAAPQQVLQLCTFATGCQAGSNGAGAGQLGTLTSGALPGSSPAVSPLNGHLFVPEPGNRRISEFSFTLNGGKEVTGVAFVKAFGGDVAPTVNEKQTVTLTGATGGTFALSFGGRSTDVSGSGDLETGSNEVANFSAVADDFAVGAEVFGPGIPAGTRITAVTFDSLTMTNAATVTSAGAPLTAAIPFDATAVAIQGALEGLSGIGSGNVSVTGGSGGPWAVEFKGALAGEDVDQLIGDGSGLTGAGPSVDVATTRVGANGTSTGLESCTVASTCQAGAEGGVDRFFVNGTPGSVAVDSTGAIYATGHSQSTVCECKVQKFNPSATSAEEFAPAYLSSPPDSTTAAVTPKLIAVDPGNDHILVAKRVSSFTFKIFEFTRSGSFVEASPPGEAGLPTSVSGVSQAGPQGLAVGTDDRAYYVLQGAPALPALGTPVRILGNPPAPQATIESATGVGQASATLAGIAEPSLPGIEGGFATVAWFEYSANGVSWAATDPVDIGTGTGAGNPNSCPTGNPPSCNLTKVVGGIKGGITYLVRLVVSNGTKAVSSTSSFTTTEAAPGVVNLAAEDVTQTTATLSGEIEPNGKSTSYHFEWGPTTSYGNRVPADFEAIAGGGADPIPVSIEVTGLQPATTYHFRIVAKSASGTTFGADQELMTLTRFNLPSNRGIELVSPANKRPVGGVKGFFGIQRVFQAAEDGDAVAYPVFNGLEDSTAGGVVVYRAARSNSGWTSSQVSSPSLVPSPKPGSNLSATPSYIKYFSPNLDCAVVQTASPLTADTPVADVENGVFNLYRWNAADNTYSLITNQPPLNPTASDNRSVWYEVAGATPDCRRIFFRSMAYDFIPESTRLYEWDSGILRDAGRRPNDTVPPGEVGDVGASRYTVSSNGRLFFTAISGEAEDNGKQAIFVRKGPGQVVNASKPTSGNPTLGAAYQAASPDGSHVFFLANYGLTSSSFSGPTDNCLVVKSSVPGTIACDLYDYDVDGGTLTNISASADPENPRGAVVQGVVDVSEDGSTVYFAARGRLVPGEGRSYSQNLNGEGFANVYRYSEGELTYVTSLDSESLLGSASGGPAGGQSALVSTQNHWVAQTTRSGDYLLYTSGADVDGANPLNTRQVYLYSADRDSTVCVSCPKNRIPTEPGEIVSQAHLKGDAAFAGNYTPRSLSGDARVFFSSHEVLAPGAVQGQTSPLDPEDDESNVYEWYRGQVSLLATGRVRMIDSSADGADVYVRSYEQILPEDFDFASDVYDFRVGSPGIAPPALAIPCDPGADQCQGVPTPSPATPNPTSSSFSGPGNAPPAAEKKKAKKNKKKKRKNKQRKQRRKAKSNRAANSYRGGAK